MRSVFRIPFEALVEAIGRRDARSGQFGHRHEACLRQLRPPVGGGALGSRGPSTSQILFGYTKNSRYSVQMCKNTLLPRCAAPERLIAVIGSEDRDVQVMCGPMNFYACKTE